MPKSNCVSITVSVMQPASTHLTANPSVSLLPCGLLPCVRRNTEHAAHVTDRNCAHGADFDFGLRF